MIRCYMHGFIGVTIRLLGPDSVNITEGENRTISIHLNSSAEREVPVMLRVLLRSAFSSMCMLISLLLVAYNCLILNRWK